MTTNYNRLRTAVYKVLWPDGVPLEFGCELVQQGIHFVVVGTTPRGEPITVKSSGAYDASMKRGANLEIFRGQTVFLGKPLSIADVLRALPRSDWALGVGGGLIHLQAWPKEETWRLTDIRFDLSLPLSDPANDAACGAVLALIG